MIIGEKDKKGNTLILGGWKADLFLTKEGLYFIDNQVTKEEEMALDLYNGLNNTSLKALPKLPTPNEPALPEGIKLPNTKGRILGIFESESNPGAYHFVIESLSGNIHCTCFGFRSPNSCWHYNSIMELGPENLPKNNPIVIKIKRSTQ